MSIVVLENYINGEFVASAATETLDLINPVDESVVGRTPVSTKEDVDAAVEAAQRAFETWGKTTPSVRQAALLKLADAIEAHSDEIVAAESANTGQAHQMIADEEVKVGADQMRFFAGAARLLEGKAAGEYMEGFTSYVRREPIGVVGQVTPWNYPFMMALWKIGPALAAGNTIVLKPSDTTPGSTLVLAKLSKGILPDGVFNVVLGNGGTGATLVENPALGLVSITGSVRAGIAVAVSAAQQLKRAHLELGGKAPAIVFGDVDIEKTATGIAEAAFFNGGQDCTAATRVIVHESIHDQLVEALVRNAEKLRPGAPSDPDAFYGPLNNINHFNAVSDKIANCRRRPRSLPAESVRVKPDSSSSRPSSPASHNRTTSCRKRLSVLSSQSRASPTRRRRSRLPTTFGSAWPRASGPRITVSRNASPLLSTSVRCGSTATSRSSPKCRTAASSIPATARISRPTESRTTPVSSTS